MMVAVWTEDRARAVVLRGPAGTGKSRLARWLGERAVETGAATYQIARHAKDDPEGEGMARALRIALRTADQTRTARRRRKT